MSDKQIIPVLNMDELQAKANEFAMKGAIESIKDFYSGYNSPYRKSINEQLEKRGVSVHFELPDIIAELNKGLANEIDLIANQAIAKSFVPLVNKLLTRTEPEVNFSSLLKCLIKDCDAEYASECDLEIEEEPRWGWLNINVTINKEKCCFTLHKQLSEIGDTKRYQLLSLPSLSISGNRIMKVSLDGGATLELPFIPNVLQGEFNSYCARLVMSQSIIIMDCDDIDEDWFHEEE